MNRLRTRTFASALIALFALPVLATAFASPAEASPYGRSYYRHGGGFYNGGQRYYLRSGRLRADAKARVNGNRYQGRVHQYYDARNNYRYERNLRFGSGARAVPHRGFGYSNYRYSTPSVGSSKYRGYGHGHSRGQSYSKYRGTGTKRYGYSKYRGAGSSVHRSYSKYRGR